MSFSNAFFAVQPPMADPTADQAEDKGDKDEAMKLEPSSGSHEASTEPTSVASGIKNTADSDQATSRSAPETATRASQKPEGDEDGDINMADAEATTPTTKSAPARKKKGTAAVVK